MKFDNIKLSVEGLMTAFQDNLAPIQDGFATLWTVMQDIWQTIGVPRITYIGELIVIVVDFITAILPSISTAFGIVCDFLKLAWDSVGKPVFDFIMEVVGWVVDWFKQYMPIIASVFNSVMDTIKNLWDSVGKP